MTETAIKRKRVQIRTPGSLTLADLRQDHVYMAPSGRLCRLGRARLDVGQAGLRHPSYEFVYLDAAGPGQREGFICSRHNVWMLRRVKGSL